MVDYINQGADALVGEVIKKFKAGKLNIEVTRTG